MKTYESCYNCGCPVVAAFNPNIMKHHIICTQCHTMTEGYDTEEEAQINWDRQWDNEWENYSIKTIYEI